MREKEKQVENFLSTLDYALELILRIATDEENFLKACQTEAPRYHLENNDCFTIACSLLQCFRCIEGRKICRKIRNRVQEIHMSESIREKIHLYR